MRRSFYFKNRFLIFVVYAILTPIALWGAKLAWDGNSNRPEDWAPMAFEETKTLYWFIERFGGDEIVMVSWQGCTLDDPRVEAFVKNLTVPVEIDGKSTRVFQQVFHGAGVLQSMQEEPLNLDRDQAIKRMKGWMLGDDNRRTGVMATVTTAGRHNRAAAIEQVFVAASQTPGLSREMLHIAGSTYDSVAIDQASRDSLVQLNTFSYIITAGLLIICLRGLRLSMLVFALAMLCQFTSMALIYFIGPGLDSVLLLVANLTYVLTISGGIHIVNYYVEARRETGWQSAVGQAIQAGWKPTLLAACTTAVGLASLTVSKLAPVVNFGYLAALSVLIASGVLLTLLPAALEQWPVGRWGASKTDADRADQGHSSGAFWQWLTDAVFGSRYVIIAVSAAVLVAGGFGVARLNMSARLHDLFPPGAKIVEDSVWLEENIGPLAPTEVVLDLPRSKDHSVLDRMYLVQQVQAKAESIDVVGGSISALNFAPPLPAPDAKGLNAVITRSITRQRLEQSRETYKQLGFLYDEGDREYWRISVRVGASDRMDLSDFLTQLRQDVSPLVARLTDEPGVHVRYAGGLAVVQKAQNQMLYDLFISFSLAFALIGVVLVAMLRSLLAGLLSLAPNVLPCLLIFGGLGWMGVSVEIGGMLTASAAMGVAVDDTLHFITWFRRGLASGMNQRDAVAAAYGKCALAMLQTTLICTLGLLVFCVSPFVPISRFAWFMFALLGVALVCDLVVLPAILLAAPARTFRIGRKQKVSG